MKPIRIPNCFTGMKQIFETFFGNIENVVEYFSIQDFSSNDIVPFKDSKIQKKVEAWYAKKFDKKAREQQLVLENTFKLHELEAQSSADNKEIQSDVKLLLGMLNPNRLENYDKWVSRRLLRSQHFTDIN